ncbi:hypothetical protein [Clostridium saccharobutylicum]|uniref:Uncharacterized protein n=1 Tax=Clostridium saccharobutylicum TaxID=169679 RepID=A0A1S8MYY9_CLOSA|nr:hypothetical protein [Clostridium saccharobutylicum]OOM09402.1 hypothetical protein CLOSAC_36830 [Clostridium saccharobutylicum]
MSKEDNQLLVKFQGAYKESFRTGGKCVLKEIYPLAGTQLREGDGRLMGTCNKLNNALNKL